MKMRCLLLLVISLFWACDDGVGFGFVDKPESMPLGEKIKGEYVFDYEHPIFFTEECRFNETSEAVKCGLIAMGVRTDADTCCSQVDFSNVMIQQKGKKENILSYATFEKTPPSVFEGEKNEHITTFSAMIFKNESDSLKINNTLIESDAKGVVEFELTDGNGKRIYVNYQMEIYHLGKYISFFNEGIVFRKNNNFGLVKNDCLSLEDFDGDSVFFSFAKLNQCFLKCDSCDMFFPVAKQSVSFCGKFNFDKSFVLEKGSEGATVDTLPFSRRFVNVYGYDKSVLYYEGGRK